MAMNESIFSIKLLMVSFVLPQRMFMILKALKLKVLVQVHEELSVLCLDLRRM
jgi:hypothetical protein